MNALAGPSRRLCAALALAVALAAHPSAASAQETGKIEGRVTTAAGLAVPGAQVMVLGTRLGNVTDGNGYYFVNNVPAGPQSVQARYLGYQPATRPLLVLAGQTGTVHFQLTQQAIVIQGIVVLGERAPLLPRDQVASKSIVTGEEVDRLPADDPRAVLTLQPGVVETLRDKGISVRGGRSGEEAVYVDGILVRDYNRGASAGGRNLRMGTNALVEADVITGGFSAEYGEARSGVINYVTRTGGRRWSGAASFASDEPFPRRFSNGTNRLELSLGGPIAGELTAFAALTAQGNRYAETGKLYRDLPVYYIDGVDTTVTAPVTDQPGDEQTVVIPRFARYDGGGRIPHSGGDLYTFSGKLDYSFGGGSRLMVARHTSRVQRRLLFGIGRAPGFYDPVGYMGELSRSGAWELAWTQNYFQGAQHALSLQVKLAETTDEATRGVLEHAWDIAHVDPFAGFTFSDMRFLIQNDCRHRTGCFPAPLDAQLVDMVWHGLGYDSATGRQAAPLGLDNTFYARKQPYRLNPWAIQVGYPTEGLDGPYGYLRERDRQLRIAVDWQAGRYHRVKLGGDYTSIETGQLSYFSTIAMPVSAYIERPRRASFFAQDRMDLGDLVIEAGLRLDRFDPNTSFPTLTGFFFPDTLNAWYRPGAETALSPRLGVSFPVTPASTFRLSYGHFVQTPELDLEFIGKNMSADQGVYPLPLKMSRTISFEFGYRHVLAPDFVLDIAAYNRDMRGDISMRVLPWDSPRNPGATESLSSPVNADFGTARGLDLRIDRRFGPFFRVMLGYGYLNARNTGTDPFSYARLSQATEINAFQILGNPATPPQTTHLTEESRKHNFSGMFSLTLPAGTPAPAALRDLGVYGTIRCASGLPYTKLKQVGDALVTGPPLSQVVGQLADGEIQTGRTPWTGSVDARVTRAVRWNGLRAQLFLEARNLFDFTNKNAVFVTTGDVTDPAAFASFASGFMVSAGGGIARTLDLTSLKTAPMVGNAANLAALRGAERRFGNGDGIFTLDEQRAAFTEATLNTSLRLDLVGPGRRLRAGLELTF